jgi:uncharacterized protein YdbL (DUF1318 family)
MNDGTTRGSRWSAARAAGFTAGLAACWLFAGPAAADSLSEAKAAGTVAERADGLLVRCPGAPAAVAALVDSVNKRRIAEYAKIADEAGASVAQVQARAGAKLVESSPYVADAGGACRKR